MKYGTDSGWVHGLVVHGRAIDGLSFAKAAAIAEVLEKIPGLVAAPNGDTSESGSHNADHPDEPMFFSFVVGALVAKAERQASQDEEADEDAISGRVDDAAIQKATALWEAHKAAIEAAVAEHGAETKVEGLLLVASGPLAGARLEGEGDATVVRIYGDDEEDEPEASLEIGEGDPDAARVRLSGSFTLKARYD